MGVVHLKRKIHVGCIIFIIENGNVFDVYRDRKTLLYKKGDANQLIQTCDPDIKILTTDGRIMFGHYSADSNHMIFEMIFDDLGTLSLQNIINIDIIENLTKINLTLANGDFYQWDDTLGLNGLEKIIGLNNIIQIVSLDNPNYN